ncbi:hypothetical protein [Vibrio sp. HN007]|uniref:hypothetical protein n=1 Tax=Vibrio iocasae TaxID=3098914 RepID=UPI0035D4BFF1
MNKLCLLATITAAINISTASARGTLGGNAPADSGAVNVSIGKCIQYILDVKAAQEDGKNASTVVIPKGCEAITEK